VEMFRKKLFYEIPETLRLGTATGTLTSTTTEIVPSTTIRN
jgi:hypothetical protein